MCCFQSRQSNGSSASGRTVKAQVSEPLPQVNSPPSSVPTPAVPEIATILSTNVPTPAVSETASILSTHVSPSFVPTTAVLEAATNLSPPSSSFAHSPPPNIAPHCADVSPPVKRPYCEDDNDILVRYPCVWYLYLYTLLVKATNTLMQVVPTVREKSLFSGVSSFFFIQGFFQLQRFSENALENKKSMSHLCLFISYLRTFLSSVVVILMESNKK
jgi:hypothetical protein